MTRLRIGLMVGVPVFAQNPSQVEWSFDGGAEGKVTFKGTFDGTTKMKGTTEYGQLGKGTFTAEKK